MHSSMAYGAEDLVSYRNPPVAEVALTVQFEPLPQPGLGFLADIWGVFGQRFPVSEAQPRLEPVVERMEPITRLNFRINIDDPSAGPRWMLYSEDKTQLLQLQNNRFSRNWRKVARADESDYPRYEGFVRDSFIEDYNELVGIYRKHKIDAPQINQCEIIYVNHVTFEAGKTLHGHLGSLSESPSEFVANVMGHELDSYRFNLSKTLEDKSGKFAGRFHASINDARFVNDESGGEVGEKLLNYVLTCRGRPLGEGLAGAMEFFDIGRSTIVSTFGKTFVQEMQERWEKE